MFIHKGIIAAAKAAARIFEGTPWHECVQVSANDKGCVAAATNGITLAAVTTKWEHLPREARDYFKSEAGDPEHFPDWRKTERDCDYGPEECVQISFNANYLVEAIQAIAALARKPGWDEEEEEFAGGEHPVVRMRVPLNPGKAIRIDGDFEEHSVVALLMPVKTRGMVASNGIGS